MSDDMCLSKSNESKDYESMLSNNMRAIKKLEDKLKEKEHEINEYIRRCQFYENIVKNLTTFK